MVDKTIAKKSMPKKPMQQKKTLVVPEKKKNVWKIVSIIFIAIFAVIILGGLIRTLAFRSSAIIATDDQIKLATTAAMSDLQSRGENVSQFTLRSPNKIRPLPPDTPNKNGMEISFYGNNIRYMYIVDVQTGAILVFSKTEFHDGLNHTIDSQRDMMPRRFMP